MTPTTLSACHQAPMTVRGDKDGTQWYACTKCDAACSPETPFDRVLRAASIVHGIPVDVIKSRKRNRPIAEARMMAIYYMLDADVRNKDIAAYFGRDHKTVSYAEVIIPVICEQSQQAMERYLRMGELLK